MSSLQMESEILGQENKVFNRSCSEMQLLRGFNDLCLGFFYICFTVEWQLNYKFESSWCFILN